MSKLTVSLPDDLHQKIREELEKQGITHRGLSSKLYVYGIELVKNVQGYVTDVKLKQHGLRFIGGILVQPHAEGEIAVHLPGRGGIAVLATAE